MTITLKVPSIACEGCAKTITEGILKKEPTAKVEVDVKTKTVMIDTSADVEKIKEIIVDLGHEIA